MTRTARVGVAGLFTALCVLIAMESTTPVVPDVDEATGIRPAVRLPAVTAAATHAPAEDHTDAWVAVILARPLFTRDRKPVGQHKTEVAAGPTELPRLAGIAVGPFGRRAIFANDDGKPLVLSEGASVAGYTIRAIHPGAVQLDGPEGQRSVMPAYDPKAHAVAADAASQPMQVPGQPGFFQPGQMPVPGMFNGAPQGMPQPMPPMRLPGMPGMAPRLPVFVPRAGNGAAWLPPSLGPSVQFTRAEPVAAPVARSARC